MRELCPGPFDNGCPHDHFKTPYGGRCHACKMERNRKKTGEKMKRYRASGQVSHKKPTKQERIKEQVALARMTEAHTFGLKGASKVLDAMQRAAT